MIKTRYINNNNKKNNKNKTFIKIKNNLFIEQTKRKDSQVNKVRFEPTPTYPISSKYNSFVLDTGTFTLGYRGRSKILLKFIYIWTLLTSYNNNLHPLSHATK